MMLRTVLPVVVLSLSLAQTALGAPPNNNPNQGPPGLPAGPPTKLFTSLEVANASGAPGDAPTFEATLTARIGGAPISGKTIRFAIEGKSGTSVPGGKINAGTAVTDASGKARVKFKLPELPQGNYALSASFAGDDRTASSEGVGNLLMVKTITKVELSDLIWGTYKGEPGPPSGTFSIKVIRTSDNEWLEKPVTITVNGKTWTTPGKPQGFYYIPLPSNATTWNVHVQFEGDAANAASSAQKTYSKPN